MAMFTAGMKESSCVEIDLKDVEAKTFMALLTYMYTGTVALSEDNAMGILALSNKYWIGPLKKRCEKFLTLHISERNACEMLLAADAHDCKRLYASACSFITQHFERVSTTPSFVQLEAPLLCDILSQDDLPASSEGAVFEAVQRWAWMNAGPKLEDALSGAGGGGGGSGAETKTTRHLPGSPGDAYLWTDERKAIVVKGLVSRGVSYSFEELVPGLADVLQHVRFPLMSSSYLYQLVEQEPFVKELKVMRDLMYEAYRYHAVGDRMAAFSHPELATTVSGEGEVQEDRNTGGGEESETEAEAMARAVAEAAAATGGGGGGGGVAVAAAAATGVRIPGDERERDADHQASREARHSGDWDMGKRVGVVAAPTPEQERQRLVLQRLKPRGKEVVLFGGDNAVGQIEEYSGFVSHSHPVHFIKTKDERYWLPTDSDAAYIVIRFDDSTEGFMDGAGRDGVFSAAALLEGGLGGVGGGGRGRRRRRGRRSGRSRSRGGSKRGGRRSRGGRSRGAYAAASPHSISFPEPLQHDV